VFAIYDRDEISSRMLAQTAEHTGLKPEDI
jgi:hypothetical protein